MFYRVIIYFMKQNEIIRGFASDNSSGVHPLISEEMLRVNAGHALGYGSDIYTDKARSIFREHLGNETDVFFVFTGTAANVLGISAVVKSWNSVITAYSAHIEQDECGALEKFSGCKVLTVDTSNGKIEPEMLLRHMHGIDFEHHSQPGVISITQATEMGTIYTIEEIVALADFAHKRGMYLHMDGARIANAAARLNISFRDLTSETGVDILSFGGTKNGMMFGEAICFLRPGLSDNFRYIRKQGMQLASKMRFIAAQYIAYFRDELWKKNASHSNLMASILADKIKSLPGVIITQAVESNAVFVVIPRDVAERVQQTYFFYPWNEITSEYRLMTSWDTTPDDIDHFIALLRHELDK